ncbi:MAG: type II secretion system F family protein [Agitococcus sp.]|nr:type II secretion system F family protein [Agitococcus sp.]MDO9176973.1 type II secretion system F family protein [Agitococcus sp.]
MARYAGKIKTRNNHVRSVEVQARTEEEALQHISKMGRVVTFKRKMSFDVGKGLTPADRQIFFARLSSMLSSRVGTSDALVLMRDTFNGKIQEVAGRLLSYVETGADLATAIEKVGTPDFPESTIALIKAGSRSGETWRSLKDAAVFEYELHNIKKGAAKGLMTGIFSFLAAGALTVSSTLYVGPKIMASDLIKASNKNGEVDIGWINTTATVMGYTMAVIMVIGFLFWLLASVGRQLLPVQADKIILKVPFYKDLVLSRDNFVVLYGLALLIKSGVRTEEALRLSSVSAPKGALRTDLTNATVAVKNGRPWPKVMQTLHPTDIAALMSASDREQVASTLDTLANQYRELYGQRLASFVPMINLAAALCMSLAGAILFGQSILPMLMASQGLMG